MSDKKTKRKSSHDYEKVGHFTLKNEDFDRLVIELNDDCNLKSTKNKKNYILDKLPTVYDIDDGILFILVAILLLPIYVLAGLLYILLLPLGYLGRFLKQSKERT